MLCNISSIGSSADTSTTTAAPACKRVATWFNCVSLKSYLFSIVL